MRSVKALVIILVLAATPARAASPTPYELLRWAPAGAQVVVAMDAATLRSHPLAQSWLLEHQAPWSGAGAEAQQFLRDAGLDPLLDVDSMLLAVVPQTGHDRGLAAFGGRYDPASLGAALVKRGARAATVGGSPVYQLAQAKGGQGASPYLFASPDVVLIGDEASLAAVLGRPARVNTLVDGELAAGRLDPRAPFWMVAAIPAELHEPAGAPEQGPAHPGGPALQALMAAAHTVRQVTLQAFLTDELELRWRAEADTAENAELLRDTVKGALAALRLHAQEQAPELVEVLRAVKVTCDGTEVKGTGVIPLALLEKLSHEAAAGRPDSQRTTL
ncbi:MAG: hypothetical protein V1750_10400 [Acidobacteriota bacterium]